MYVTKKIKNKWKQNYIIKIQENNTEKNKLTKDNKVIMLKP